MEFCTKANSSDEVMKPKEEMTLLECCKVLNIEASHLLSKMKRIDSVLFAHQVETDNMEGGSSCFEDDLMTAHITLSCALELAEKIERSIGIGE